MSQRISSSCKAFGLARAFVLVGASLFALAPASAQYPGQIKKDDAKAAPELRAVAVVEFTGDAGHPKASRLVPISLFDGQQLQDASLYLARPYPLALQGETEYQIQLNGRAVGYFDVKGAGQSQGSWVGEGTWKPLVTQSARQARAPAKIKIDDDDAPATDGPVLHRKEHDDDASGAGSAPADPDRPTLHRAPDAGSDSTASGGAPSDPDRPTLHRSTSADSSDSGGTAPDDPDRPRLQKKPAQQASASDRDEGSVDSVATVTDPSRPTLHRGKPTDDGLAVAHLNVAPTAMGLPADMHQQVAVSDAKTTPDHPWNFTWANLDDEAKMKSALEAKARTALGLDPPPAPAKTTPARAGTRASASKTAAQAPPALAPLLDEQFRVFELAYGSGATMVFSAHTDGSGAQQKFVTLIAQPDLYGSAVVLLKNVTDASHLDDTPRMRLVDAVDAMADNRGELLFELRGATQRQFALYRVTRGSAEKLFATTGTFFGSATGE